MNGVQYLTEAGLPPAAICGIYTLSPLLIEEVKAFGLSRGADRTVFCGRVDEMPRASLV